MLVEGCWNQHGLSLMLHKVCTVGFPRMTYKAESIPSFWSKASEIRMACRSLHEACDSVLHGFVCFVCFPAFHILQLILLLGLGLGLRRGG